LFFGTIFLSRKIPSDPITGRESKEDVLSGILVVFAHPDDESLSAGGTLCHYRRRGVQTALLTFTDGQVGKQGVWGDMSEEEKKEFGAQRREELLRAARWLEIGETITPGWMEGSLNRIPDEKGVALVVEAIRRLKPEILISFGPEGGGNGHEDHKATGRWAALAFDAAADPGHPSPLTPHSVSKYYWVAWNEGMSVVRGRESERFTAAIELGREVLQAKRKAFDEHKTQQYLMTVFDGLEKASEGKEYFHLAKSRIERPSGMETDLLEGLS
jgi:LmbE family N-acetylglucosaminyl deacetylase